jgi:hypothetical protein
VETNTQTVLIVALICMGIMLFFFMMVAFAAILVARVTGRGLMGPILGPILSVLSVRRDASDDDDNARHNIPAPRHIDPEEFKAKTQALDFEQAVEKYRAETAPPLTTLPPAPVAQTALPANDVLPPTPIAPPVVPDSTLLPNSAPPVPGSHLDDTPPSRRYIYNNPPPDNDDDDDDD